MNVLPENFSGVIRLRPITLSKVSNLLDAVSDS